MSIKINVGVNKKIGLPDYGSAGSMCNIEIEADNVVLSDPEQFLQRVKDAFDVARLAVDEELSHHRVNKSAGQSNREPEPEPRREYRSESSSSENRYIASEKQMSFVWTLAKTVKMDKRRLEKYCDARFGKASTQLSSREASELINELKDAKSGGKELSI